LQFEISNSRLGRGSKWKTPPDTELPDGVRGNDTTAKQRHGGELTTDQRARQIEI